MGFLKLLKPNRRGVLLFVLFIIVHVLLIHWFGTVTYYKNTTETRLGYGALVIRKSVKEYAEPDDRSYQLTVRINWHWVIVLVVGTYLVTNLVGHGITGLFPRKKPKLFLTQVVGGGLVLAIVAASVCTKQLWGYYLGPPPVDGRIAGARQVISLTPVSTQENADGTREFVVDPNYTIVKCGDTSPGGYYALELRAIYTLQERGKLPDPLEPLHSEEEADYHPLFDGYKWKLPEGVTQMKPEQVAPLYALAASTGLIYPGDTGYERGELLSGIVLEAKGPGDERLLFIAVAGKEVSNDHYPYYEFLFSVPQGDGEPRFLACDRWFYDNAGVEFLTWPFLFIVFVVPAILVALFVVDIVIPLFSAFWRRTRAAPQGATPAGTT
jgi:hypothetical protein